MIANLVRTLFLACGLVAAVALLSACSPTTSVVSVHEGCLNTSQPPADAPVYLAVDDLTRHQASASAARVDAFAAMVRAAFTHGAEVVLAESGAEPDSDRLVFSALAVPTGPNDTFRRFDTVCALRTMTQQFEATDAVQAPGPSDALGALSVFAGDLHSLAGHRVDALVISDGLEGDAPMNLVADPTFLDDPSVSAAALKNAGVLPDLKGWSVAFLSDGEGSDEALQALDALWWQVVASSGGTLVGFQQSLLSWPLQPITALAAPGVVRVPSAPGTIDMRVPERLLFDVDQATLRPDAGPVIAQLASLLISQYPDSTAVVAGYCDSTGSADWNRQLSRERADTVVTALEAAGIAAQRLQAVGYGATDFVATNATEAGRAANRRVEVVFTTGSPQ